MSEESTKLRLSEQQAPRMIHARFDAAQRTDDNARHWAAADGLSPDAAYSPQVRKTLRERARLEIENNSYARGIVWTKVNDVIGAGPRLQVLPLGDSKSAATLAERVEHAFARWAIQICFAEKLRTIYGADIVDGEGLGELVTNNALMGPVKLDLQLFECDRLATPHFNGLNDLNLTDGIHFDNWGNVSSYEILNNHPGDTRSWANTARKVPAKYVLHLFKLYRAEQHRGVTSLAPALPLFADLRRYTAAVVAAAETAADFAMVLQTTGASAEVADIESMDKIELQKRMATTLPEGWTLGQVKAEQPTTGYGDFKYQVISELARCLNMPYIIAAGDSSKSNFASAKLDGRGYEREIRIEQTRIERLLDQSFGMFLEELSFQPGYQKAAGLFGQHVWMWQGQAEVDPREASANQTKLDTMQMTLADFHAKHGRDWETTLRQLAREADLKKELGLTAPDTNTNQDRSHANPDDPTNN